MRVVDAIWDNEPPSRRRVCMLMITHACNLNCCYCYESHKSDEYMSIEFAKEIILKEAKFVKESDEYEDLQVDFMGGEPMMNFKLIKEIVEWLENDAIDIPWISFASTNATLIDDDVRDWLKLHKEHFVLGVSYDGTKYMQSKNRGTDKYEINLDFFHKLWPEESFHMTISKETLPNLAEGVLEIQRKGYSIEAALAQGVDWTIEDAELYRKEAYKLKDAYLKDTNLKPLNRLTRFVDVFDLPSSEKKQIRTCGTGIGMTTYDINGERYGCHMFTPMVLGKEKALPIGAEEWKKTDSMSDPFCADCVLRSFCPTCPGFNYKYRGDFNVRDKRWCPLALAEAITACEFQIERIALIENLSELDAQHAQSAIKAYNILKHLDIRNSKSPYTIRKE